MAGGLRVWKTTNPARVKPGGVQCVKAGDNLLSRWTHYHRPQVLIGRVRDGNGSFHLGMVTGSSVPSSIRPNRVLAIREEGVYHG